MIPVVCGNDFYNGSWNDAVGFAAADFCEAARTRCDHVFAVVGMSAQTWQYSGSCAPAYDVACLSLKRSFVDPGVPCVASISDLQGLKLADTIGHVQEDSGAIVFAAYKSWVRQCVVGHIQPKPAIAPERCGQVTGDAPGVAVDMVPIPPCGRYNCRI